MFAQRREAGFNQCCPEANFEMVESSVHTGIDAQRRNNIVTPPVKYKCEVGVIKEYENPLPLPNPLSSSKCIQRRYQQISPVKQSLSSERFLTIVAKR